MRTREALEQVRVVFSSLQDAEIGGRGYALTGDEESLPPYLAAERSLEGQLTQLQSLASEAEGRQIAMDLTKLARAQLMFVTDVVATRRSQDAPAALALVHAGTGKRQMDRIRELVAAFETHEKDLLAQRRGAFERRSQGTEGAVRMALFAAILLMVTAGVLLVWHTQRRVRAERAARETVSLLHSTMENVSQGVAVFDAHQRLIAWNARYLELRGLTPLQVRAGMTWTDILEVGAKLVVLDQPGRRDADEVPAIMAAGKASRSRLCAPMARRCRCAASEWLTKTTSSRTPT